LDEAEIAELAAGYAVGVPIAQLVEQFQIDQTTVQKYVRQRGLPRRSGRLGPHQLDDAVRHYQAGRSVEFVAHELGRRHSPVSSMRTIDIVVDSPVLDDDLGFEQALEQLAVQELVAGAAVERLDPGRCSKPSAWTPPGGVRHNRLT